MTKAKLRSIIITFMVTVGVCCPLFAGGNPIGKDNQSDSLLTRDHIYEYTFSDTVKAARIINTIATISSFSTSRLRPITGVGTDIT